MLTVGGAISGYSVTGSARSTSAPVMVSRIDSTAAKIGRSMKKWEKRMRRSLARNCHCEEQSDEAIQWSAQLALDCFVAPLLAMTEVSVPFTGPRRADCRTA